MANHAIQILLHNFYLYSDYVDNKTAEAVDDLQNFITKNHLTTKDKGPILSWIKRNSMVSIEIISNKKVIYSTTLSHMEYEIDGDDTTASD